VLEDVRCNGARNPPHVVESEIVGNEAAPAVGTEFDLGHRGRWSSVVGRSLYAVRRSQMQIPRFVRDDFKRTLRTTDDQRLTTAFHTNFFSFFSSRYFTTLPTSCDWSSVVTSSASSVSTITRSLTPTRATNFPGART